MDPHHRLSKDSYHALKSIYVGAMLMTRMHLKMQIGFAFSDANKMGSR
jgi:hypothetical protein